MKLLKVIYELYEIIISRKDEAIYTCLKNDIPLTDENVAHVIEILKYKKRHAINKELFHSKIQNH